MASRPWWPVLEKAREGAHPFASRSILSKPELYLAAGEGGHPPIVPTTLSSCIARLRQLPTRSKRDEHTVYRCLLLRAGSMKVGTGSHNEHKNAFSGFSLDCPNADWTVGPANLCRDSFSSVAHCNCCTNPLIPNGTKDSGGVARISPDTSGSDHGRTTDEDGSVPHSERLEVRRHLAARFLHADLQRVRSANIGIRPLRHGLVRALGRLVGLPLHEFLRKRVSAERESLTGPVRPGKSVGAPTIRGLHGLHCLGKKCPWILASPPKGIRSYQCK